MAMGSFCPLLPTQAPEVAGKVGGACMNMDFWILSLTDAVNQVINNPNILLVAYVKPSHSKELSFISELNSEFHPPTFCVCFFLVNNPAGNKTWLKVLTQRANG